MYKQYNPNPKYKYAGDCVIRALSKILNQDWDTTYLQLSVRGFNYKDLPNANCVWEGLLRDKGFTKMLLPTACPDCYTVKQFCKDFPEGEFIVATGSHIVAIQNGDYYDAWDSGDEILTEYWRQNRD